MRPFPPVQLPALVQDHLGVPPLGPRGCPEDLATREATRTSLVAQPIKNPPAVQETWVPSLGREDTLEKGKATHSSILAWRIPWTV